jgi:hypothetical protein
MDVNLSPAAGTNAVGRPACGAIPLIRLESAGGTRGIDKFRRRAGAGSPRHAILPPAPRPVNRPRPA